MNDNFAKDLQKAQAHELPSREIRGLEFHLSPNRSKFAGKYVRAVVEKSLALRTAKHLGKDVHVESRLQAETRLLVVVGVWRDDECRIEFVSVRSE